MKKKVLIITILLLFLGTGAYFASRKINLNRNYQIGTVIDSLNHVQVFYNGPTGTIVGRNTTDDGYNLGLKYQCVEFIKRYYYEHYKHKMPNSYGNAIDFFDPNIEDGHMNKARNLLQFKNTSSTKPCVGDILIYSATLANQFGHVCIVAQVNDDEIQIIQQNPGQFAKSRIWFNLDKDENKWTIDNDRVLGWLRKD
jgi:surface antigen